MPKSVALAALLLLAACGGSSFNSGLPRKAELGSLSDAQTCQLYENAYDWSQRTFSEDFCILIAQSSGIVAQAFGEDFTPACEVARDECLADLDDDAPRECSTVAIDPGCTTSVGDLEDCYSETAALFRDLARSGCAPLSDEEIAARSDTEFETPEVCDAIDEECPSLF